MSTPVSKHMIRGYIFCLGYHHFPSTNGIVICFCFISVYYVVVRLLKDDAVMEVQKTRTSGGRGALWNQAFLFNIVGGGIHSYSLEFLVMKGKLHKKDLVVGKVEIGPNSSRVGREHWKCMISPRPIDVAKWHNILPVFAY